MAAIVRRGKPAASLEARVEEERARQRPGVATVRPLLAEPATISAPTIRRLTIRGHCFKRRAFRNRLTPPQDPLDSHPNLRNRAGAAQLGRKPENTE